VSQTVDVLKNVHITLFVLIVFFALHYQSFFAQKHYFSFLGLYVMSNIFFFFYTDM